MSRPIILLSAVGLAFLIMNEFFGFETSYRIGYGAFTLMAAMISLTFLWLWARRATPLAMGMSFGWAGAASVMGWWWSFSALHQPDWMVENPVLLMCLSVYCVGAMLHFQVIGRSFGHREKFFLLPVGGSVVVSALVHFLI